MRKYAPFPSVHAGLAAHSLPVYIQHHFLLLATHLGNGRSSQWASLANGRGSSPNVLDSLGQVLDFLGCVCAAYSFHGHVLVRL